ncbi:MAG: response regulator [Sandaracinaceae bacterium]|nr:MAG: response regulator [Sandaracinaceae bacterium]
MKPTVLVVDDDVRFRAMLTRAFETRGWEVTAVASGEEALEAARRESPEHALVDLRMPGMSGLELVDQLLAIDAATHVVLLTGYGSIATAVEAVRRGAVDYLTKPAEIDEILRAFQKKAGEAVEPPESVPSLARAEWEHINRVLTDCDGNISQAARLLGLHRRTLQRKLSKYPVSR